MGTHKPISEKSSCKSQEKLLHDMISSPDLFIQAFTKLIEEDYEID